MEHKPQGKGHNAQVQRQRRARGPHRERPGEDLRRYGVTSDHRRLPMIAPTRIISRSIQGSVLAFMAYSSPSCGSVLSVEVSVDVSADPDSRGVTPW